MMVSKEHAICVPVKADAQLSLAGTHFGCHYFRVQRAAVFVDVASVGSAVGEVRRQATPPENFGGYGAGCAIGTIHYNFEWTHARDRTRQPFNISIMEIGIAGKRRTCRPWPGHCSQQLR